MAPHPFPLPIGWGEGDAFLGRLPRAALSESLCRGLLSCRPYGTSVWLVAEARTEAHSGTSTFSLFNVSRVKVATAGSSDWRGPATFKVLIWCLAKKPESFFAA